MSLVTSKEREIRITVDGDASNLVGMQQALIELMQHYNFKDFGSDAGDTMHYGMELLSALMPSEDQQVKGFN
jgi:hypothetical protein